jgi:CheY-like chemotaxis protein
MLKVLGFEVTIVSDGAKAVESACQAIAATATGARPEFTGILMDVQVQYKGLTLTVRTSQISYHARCPA